MINDEILKQKLMEEMIKDLGLGDLYSMDSYIPDWITSFCDTLIRRGWRKNEAK